MKNTICISLLFAVLLFSIPHPLQAKSDFLYEESFESPFNIWSEHWIQTEVSTNNIDPIASGYTGEAIQVTINKGTHKGSELILPSSIIGAHDANIVGITYWLRIDTEFPIESQGKLPGPIGPMTSGGKGGNSCQDETACWSSRLFYSACRNQRQTECPAYSFGNYVYGPDQTSDTGEFYFADSSLKLEPHRWHCVQIFVRMNTPGQADGLSMTFIDGQIEQGVTAYMMYRREGDTSGFRGFWLNFYQGGKEPAASDMKISLDELQISDSLIPQTGCLQDVPELLAGELTLHIPDTQSSETAPSQTTEDSEKSVNAMEELLQFIFSIMRRVGLMLGGG